MILTKFGGTSVADAKAILRLIEIVRSRLDRQPVVVVSALAGMTDELLELAHQCGAAEQRQIEERLTALLDHHEEVGRDLPGCSAAVESVRGDIEELRQELRAAADRRLSHAEVDRLAARGEIWSSRLVAAAMKAAGLEGLLGRHSAYHGHRWSLR